jgi:hypothetical protein
MQGKGNRAKLPSSRFLLATLRAMTAAYVAVLAFPATREFFALDVSPWVVVLARWEPRRYVCEGSEPRLYDAPAMRPLRCRSTK